MRSSSKRPTGLSAKAVTMAVFRPKQRLSPRATLYSPPPSETSKFRVVHTRRSPGSKRNITSPRLTRSQRHSDLGLTFSAMHYSRHLNLGFRDQPVLRNENLHQPPRNQVT